MMKSLKKKFHIFRSFCLGDIFQSILDKFMNMVDFDIFGIYLCIWSLLNNLRSIVNNYIYTDCRLWYIFNNLW